MSIKIVTDSTSYIDAETREKMDITIIPLSVSFPDESFKETEVDYSYFYNKIKTTGIIPSSSQPAQGEIEQLFAGIVAEGHELIAIFLSSEMSGTYQSALSARERVLQEYPEARMEIIDSRTNCMAMGAMAVTAARAVQEGKSMSEAVEAVRKVMKRIKFYFVPAGLEYLKKGGRIGGAAALLGSILKINPILYVLDGKTDLWGRARGNRAAIEQMLTLLENDYRSCGLKYVLVHHISCPEKAGELAQLIRTRYNLDVEMVSIGPVIGLHVGPGTLGIVYITENQPDQ